MSSYAPTLPQASSVDQLNLAVYDELLQISRALDQVNTEASSDATWGNIGGSISDQDDLSTALDGKADASHTHFASDITGGTFDNARISEANVTQHEGALNLTQSQISDLSSTDDLTEGTSNLYYTDARAISAIQNDPSWNASNWDTAYDRSPIGLSYSTGTIQLDLQNSATLQTDIDGVLQGAYSIERRTDIQVEPVLTLVNDESDPGTSMLYGTDGGGTKGWVVNKGVASASMPNNNTIDIDLVYGGTVSVGINSVLQGTDSIVRDESFGVGIAKLALDGDEASPTQGKVYAVGVGGKGWYNFSEIEDHGGLAGLGDDDHPQYLLANGSREVDSLFFDNHEQGDFSEKDGRIFHDASAGIYHMAVNTPNSKTNGNLLWSSANVSTSGNIFVTYDGEDLPTIYDSDTPDFVSVTVSGQYNVGGGSHFFGRNTNGWGIQYSNNEYSIYGNQNSYVMIRYNNNNKARSKSGGWYVYGNCEATDFNATSSRRWKKNIERLPVDINKFLCLTPVEFDWRDDYEGWNRSQGKHSIGLIVEEVAPFFPEAAIKELDHEEKWTGHYSGIDYGKLAAPHIAVTQNHERRIQRLEAQLQQMEIML